MRTAVSTLSFGLTIAALCAAPTRAADAPSRAHVAIPMKVQRYAQHVIENHDTDDDGRLTQREWTPINGPAKLADRDRDAVLTAAELADYIARYGRRRKILLMPAPQGESVGFPSLLRPEEKPPKEGKSSRLASAADDGVPPTPGRAVDATSVPDKKLPVRRFTVPRSRLPAGLPSWFRSLDRNGDAQLTLAEFSPEGVVADVKEFAQYDLNGDGILTADEFERSSRAPAGRAPAQSAPRVQGNDGVAGDKANQGDEADEGDAEDEAGMKERGPTSEPDDAASAAAERKTMSAKEKADLKKLKRTQSPPQTSR